jgi:primosomal protein N' (replication factor Y)
LHGVTGSGKTEVYIQLIEHTLKQNKQVLYLLPEIALTSQIIGRLQKHFGNDVGVYHSRFNEQERAEIWVKTLRTENSYKIILGARSAIFLPFQNLGLIIIDEEHETTYKQQDPAPRYHARDCALVLASIYKANVLLGSATPSYESYYNALNGKYQLAEIKNRYLGTLMPQISCVDISKIKPGERIFSDELLSEINTALQKKEQIILFQNRRGYTPLWMCETCGWIYKCTQCDVSLTYHKNTGQLHCHYCGSTYKPLNKCKACGSHHVKMIGFGTEKIEEELAILIPEAKCSRLDLDSTRNKHAYYNILNDFENQEIDILVGTQMVTKGLDFSNVSLVAILNADSLLSYPDFRSYERAFQLCAQVAGRAGRKDKQGKVIVQTRNPKHWVLQKVIANDYIGMYEAEILERKNFNYPPFSKLIQVTLKHKERNKVAEAATILYNNLKSKIGKRILGPEKPVIEKIRNEYLRSFLIKSEKNSNYKLIKQEVVNELHKLQQIKDLKQLRFIIDVDCN